MNVYYNKNGNPWGHNKRAEKLTSFPVNQTFLWQNQEVFIPAAYTGKSGAILDICIKIPIEDMAAFLKKWNEERRLSLRTKEDFEQMESDNPCSIDFETEMSFNEISLQQCMSSSLMWYPAAVFTLEEDNEITPAARSAEFYDEEDLEKIPSEEEWQNDKDAEKLMQAYGCDRNFCWYLGRLVYSWKKEPVLSPERVCLTLKAMPKPVTAAYFTTDPSCFEQKLKTTHPVTGQEYILTLHNCKIAEIPFSGFGGAEGMRYPNYCQELSYSISPKPEPLSLDILDCTEGDHPKKESDLDHTLSESCGPTAVFAIGKTGCPDSCTAFSSLHFEPVPNVRWRIVFQIKPREDAVICFPIENITPSAHTALPVSHR